MFNTFGALTRRQLLAGTGILLLGTALPLGGCAGAGGVKGKTLYFVSTYTESGVPAGTEQTITFDNSDGWHAVVGKKEQTGTWTQEGDNIVLSTASGTSKTLRKLEGQNAYELSGYEEAGERYFFTHDEAQAWYEEYQAQAVEHVKQVLEGNSWTCSRKVSDSSVPETVSFANGNITYTTCKLDVDDFVLNYYRGYGDSSWCATNHDGAYDLTVEVFRGTNGLKYSGDLSVGDAKAYFLLVKEGNGTTLYLGSYYDLNNSEPTEVTEVNFTSAA